MTHLLAGFMFAESISHGLILRKVISIILNLISILHGWHSKEHIILRKVIRIILNLISILFGSQSKEHNSWSGGRSTK